MNTICPVCNGFSRLLATCDHCHKYLQDKGRLSDYQGDYSPYRPIDDLKLSNGYKDAADHLCLHLCFCAGCGCEQVLPVKEQIMPPPT
ncbi:hypothetical protein [Brevibacillus daliensis]|uniref:hypothetical protein n=1 Tax=Brevibacillus daliensis TaxID=2892995 RepID=UPI001E60C5C9|nr:hypothetical protein [Brevibacillus daliensis]